MPSDDSRYFRFWLIARTQVALLVIGFFGLLGGKLLREQIGLSEKEFIETALGGLLTWTAVVCWLSGLLLVPVTIILRNRAGIEVAKPLAARSCFAWTLFIALACCFLLAAAAVVYESTR